MREWVAGMQGRVARAVGEDPAAYELGESDVDALLDLARVAAHESGDRTNAPLAAYLVGLARGRHDDAALDGLIAASIGKERSDSG